MAAYRGLVVSESTHVIENVVMCDTDVPWEAPPGFVAVTYAGPSAPGWLWDGTTATPPPLPPPTQKDYESAIQRALDAYAAAWGYTDLARAVTYIGDPNPQFDLEGIALRNWRSAVWVKGGQILATIDPAKPPTIQEVLAQLPAAPSRPVASPPGA